MKCRILIKMLLDRAMQTSSSAPKPHVFVWSFGCESNIWKCVSFVCFVLEMQKKRMSRNSEFGTVPIAPLGCTYGLLIFRRLMIGIMYVFLYGRPQVVNTLCLS